MQPPLPIPAPCDDCDGLSCPLPPPGGPAAWLASFHMPRTPRHYAGPKGDRRPDGPGGGLTFTPPVGCRFFGSEPWSTFSPPIKRLRAVSDALPLVWFRWKARPKGCGPAPDRSERAPTEPPALARRAAARRLGPASPPLNIIRTGAPSPIGGVGHGRAAVYDEHARRFEWAEVAPDRDSYAAHPSEARHRARARIVEREARALEARPDAAAWWLGAVCAVGPAGLELDPDTVRTDPDWWRRELRRAAPPPELRAEPWLASPSLSGLLWLRLGPPERREGWQPASPPARVSPPSVTRSEALGMLDAFALETSRRFTPPALAVARRAPAPALPPPPDPVAGMRAGDRALGEAVLAGRVTPPDLPVAIRAWRSLADANGPNAALAAAVAARLEGLKHGA